MPTLARFTAGQHVWFVLNPGTSHTARRRPRVVRNNCARCFGTLRKVYVTFKEIVPSCPAVPALRRALKFPTPPVLPDCCVMWLIFYSLLFAFQICLFALVTAILLSSLFGLVLASLKKLYVFHSIVLQTLSLCIPPQFPTPAS